MNIKKNIRRFGTSPVFFTAIATILGAILFLRFGFATGVLGFWGIILIILVGHAVTIPTALALSEIATNQKVEGGGEYYVISRSFGLNIGGAIGIALYLSQAISVAFYVIAFTEAFEPLFNFIHKQFNFTLPRQVVSLPAMTLLSAVILKRGANLGVKTLYVVAAILFGSLLLFFLGEGTYGGDEAFANFTFRNREDFFMVFAIVFPAFTGMTAGVGLSGDLKNPGRSIPVGTLSATIAGMIIYLLVAWKLASSAPPAELINEQLIMTRIAMAGAPAILLGLAASTVSSAIGSFMVAPRTLQALARDRSLPVPRLNSVLGKGRGETNEPFNASLLTCIIAFVFVGFGSVNIVAGIITMFFLVTYGSLCLISFLNHFGADPSYRPRFKSRWYISLAGFVMSIWLMFKINTAYAIAAGLIMALIYSYISARNKHRKGLEVIFQGAIHQLARKIQIYLQKSKKVSSSSWRPSVVCVSRHSFERGKPFELINWISHRYGFATYIHLIDGYFSKATYEESNRLLSELIERSDSKKSNVYVDTLISPSYTSAIAQIIQLPSISGMENNMILFEYDKNNPGELKQIIENYSLVRAGNFDVCIFGCSSKPVNFKKGIHVWIKPTDTENSTLMILLSYVIHGHPDWHNSHIKIFSICREAERDLVRKQLLGLIQKGQLPISPNNIEIICSGADLSSKYLINEKSAGAALTLIGFRSEQLKHAHEEVFKGYDSIGDVIFVNANKYKEIK